MPHSKDIEVKYVGNLNTVCYRCVITVIFQGFRIWFDMDMKINLSYTTLLQFTCVSFFCNLGKILRDSSTSTRYIEYIYHNMEQQAIRLHNEDSYLEYGENFVMLMQESARRKPQMAYSAVISAIMKVEDMAYLEALKATSQPLTSNLWDNVSSIDEYQGICETIHANLKEFQRSDWSTKFAENPPLGLFRTLSGRSAAAYGQSLEPPPPPTIPKKRGRPPKGSEHERIDTGRRPYKKKKKSVKEGMKVQKMQQQAK